MVPACPVATRVAPSRHTLTGSPAAITHRQRSHCQIARPSKIPGQICPRSIDRANIHPGLCLVNVRNRIFSPAGWGTWEQAGEGQREGMGVHQPHCHPQQTERAGWWIRDTPFGSTHEDNLLPHVDQQAHAVLACRHDVFPQDRIVLFEVPERVIVFRGAIPEVRVDVVGHHALGVESCAKV